ncbi:MAG TPA: hypothetical protein VE046_11275 [Steroidobacteraceae bacterium]|nr:hypothetical protein [Steroidobacteraceae bacterium]
MGYQLKAGDLVEVRSREEILATLDGKGCIDRMPFMPEMLKYCGRRLRVSAVAHKTCDSAHKTGGRRLKDAVHLEELRCDGAAHGGCQATCLIFWKTSWLRKLDGDEPAGPVAPAARDSGERLNGTTERVDAASGKTVYTCQATELYYATTLQKWWDFRQFWRDLRTRNVTLRRALRVLTVASARSLTHLGFAHRAAFWFYDRVHRLVNGWPAPQGTGELPIGQPTPACHLDLVIGERVRVLSHAAIKTTLNTGSRNRGMWFDHEMVKFCGRNFRVSGRVNRIIDEVTGEMLTMKQPCIVLEGVHCTAEYTDGRLMCRRAVTTYWREGWLERLQPDGDASTGEAAGVPRTNATSASTRSR